MDATQETALLVRMPKRTRRLLDYIAAEKVRREGAVPGRNRGHRNEIIRQLIEREYERMQAEQPV